MSNPIIFSTPQAADNTNISVSSREPAVNENVLKSSLFQGDKNLTLVLNGRAVLAKAKKGQYVVTSKFHWKVAVALKIVIPEISNTGPADFLDLQANFNLPDSRKMKYTWELAKWVKHYQEKKSIQDPKWGGVSLGADGIVGKNTLKALDQDLHDIRYYDLNKQKTIHNSATSYKAGFMTIAYDADSDDFHQSTPIDYTLAENLITTYDEPSTGFSSLGKVEVHNIITGNDVEVFAKLKTWSTIRLVEFMAPYSPVYPIIEGNHQGWAFIEVSLDDIVLCNANSAPPYTTIDLTVDQLSPHDQEKLTKFRKRYIRNTQVWHTEMPDPGAKLHRVDSGDLGLLEIAQLYYPNIATSGVDSRYYANLLLYMNNPGGKSSVTKTYLAPKEPSSGETNKRNKRHATYSLSQSVPASVYLENSSNDTWASEVDSKTYDSFTTGLSSNDMLPVRPLSQTTWSTWETKMNTAAGTSTTDWANTKIIANTYMWIPSRAYADGLKDVVNTGQVASSLTNLKQTINTLIATAKNAANEILIDFLKEHWKIGYGFDIDVGIGATFGIPIALDADHQFSIYRESENVLKITRRGIIGVGIDTGIGGKVGVNLGSSGGKTNRYGGAASQGKTSGINMNAGIQVYAGLQLLVHQEITIDFTRNYALLKILLSALLEHGPKLITNPVMFVSSLLTGFRFFDLDPNDYTTKLKIELAARAEVNAGVSGIELGDPEAEAYNQSSENKVETQSFSDMFSARNIMGSAKAFFQGKIEVALGVEINWRNNDSELKYNELNGLPYWDRIDVDIYLEGEASLSALAQLQIPLTKIKFPAFSASSGIGGGIKVSLEYEYDEIALKQGGSLSLSEFTSGSDKFISIYQKRGDMDREVPASERGIRFKIPNSFPTTIPAIVGLMDKIYIKKKIGLDLTGNSKLTRAIDKKIAKYIDVKKANEQMSKWGLSLGGYLQYEYSISPSTVLSVLENLYEDIHEYYKELTNDPNKPIEESFYQVLNHISEGYFSTLFTNHLLDLFDAVNKDDIKVHYYFHIGADFSAGFKAGAGAKVRLELSAAFKLFYREDLSEIVKNHFRSVTNNNLSLDKRKDNMKELIMAPATFFKGFIDDGSNL